jgi:hypothetical protein
VNTGKRQNLAVVLTAEEQNFRGDGESTNHKKTNRSMPRMESVPS